MEKYLYVSDTQGSVFEVNLDDALIKSDTCSTHLLGCHHQADMKVFLFALKGTLSTNGFLSNVGCPTKNDGMSLASIKHIPCNVLLAMGAGYKDVFHSAEVMSDPPLHLTTWVSPCSYLK